MLCVFVLAGAGSVYLKLGLPDVGNAPNIKIELTQSRIIRGKYLANQVLACMDCHSKRDENRFAGPIIQGTFGGGGTLFSKNEGFPGELYSSNITPYALKDWTDGEIYRAITAGVNKNGKALFPVMNYPAYGAMDKEDIYAVIAYLRSIPPLKNDIQERKLDFPLNLLVNTMPFRPKMAVVKPDTTDKVLYGGYLVKGASCMDCHSKVDKGKIVSGTEFGGGREFQYGKGNIVRSSNISPDLSSGIGNWTEKDFMARFRLFANVKNSIKVNAEDFNTPMPWLWYAGMTTNDLSAIYHYLKTVKPINNHVDKFTPSTLSK